MNIVRRLLNTSVARQCIRKCHEEILPPKIELKGAISAKFQIFRDSDSVEIFDVEEQRTKVNEDAQSLAELHHSIYANLNLKRGTSGVFEIEDLVDVLKKDNAVNLFVCSVPREMKYVDYICIVTGKSHRHMLGMANFVRKVYKMKRNSSDILPKVEGEKCKNWMALDLGNIALHIFSKTAREKYDLEVLWTMGEEYDRTLQIENIRELYENTSYAASS
ncbi:unnamed protein product [Diamesa serratosioi]